MQKLLSLPLSISHLRKLMLQTLKTLFEISIISVPPSDPQIQGVTNTAIKN